MADGGRGDFYVGYQKRAPRGLARFTLRTALSLVLGAGALAVLLAALQKPFDPGTFEFGVVREFEGVARERPYPALEVDHPNSGSRSSFALVAFGKHGGGAEIAGLDGRRVRLEGSLVYRDGETMLEIRSGSVEALEDAGGPGPHEVDLGPVTLEGEIVDSKCFLGVMKPGRGKPHRSCAARCISGGIPPALLAATGDGDWRLFFLVDADGRPLGDRVLPWVGEPVIIHGRATRSGDRLLLAADPAGFRRRSG